VILPAWLFLEEFGPGLRRRRVVAAMLAAAVALIGGLLVAGLTDGLPPLLSGALGATLSTVLYASVWFYGVHWLARRTG
jgi:hypothetical protein